MLNGIPPHENIFENSYKDTENPLDNLAAFQAEFAKLEKELEPNTGQTVGGISETKHFDKAIFDNLPDVLRFGCQILTDASEMEVFLVGALGVVSGILPNVQGFYDGKYICPNLFVYILAKYGTGKGSLHFSRLLALPVHRQKSDLNKDAKAIYEAEKLQYEQELKQFRKQKGGTATPPEPPAEPPAQMLFLPANNSKTGIFELLAGNGGKGIIFETEGDTLADAFKQDYGNFSDGCRKAFQHEPISYYRRTGREHVEIESPCLSLVLSSTYDQLLNLIPTIENGLFSRFLFYELDAAPDFRNVFDARKTTYPESFAELGNLFQTIHSNLEELTAPVTVTLTEKQQAKFLQTFQEWKAEIREYVSEDLEGTVNRLGLICFRVAMIFTVLRHFEGNRQFSDVLTCEDVDFENALRIIAILKRQAVGVFYRMPPSKSGQRKKEPKDENLKQKAKELRAKGMSYGDIEKELRQSKGKVYYWLNN
ncbi:MAG: DUF3987 domain-containing protein [Lewinellaceae bacterium]|nr:DUF3987 domain-containing protein [Lewinellaceae bacterium]